MFFELCFYPNHEILSKLTDSRRLVSEKNSLSASKGMLKCLDSFRAKLYKNYKIEIPIIPWENKSFARISYQLYNTEKDLGKLEYTLKKLIKQF
jgi:hypothetical protein